MCVCVCVCVCVCMLAHSPVVPGWLRQGLALANAPRRSKCHILIIQTSTCKYKRVGGWARCLVPLSLYFSLPLSIYLPASLFAVPGRLIDDLPTRHGLQVRLLDLNIHQAQRVHVVHPVHLDTVVVASRLPVLPPETDRYSLPEAVPEIERERKPRLESCNVSVCNSSDSSSYTY